jgi:hypothetical protein
MWNLRADPDDVDFKADIAVFDFAKPINTVEHSKTDAPERVSQECIETIKAEQRALIAKRVHARIARK